MAQPHESPASPEALRELRARLQATQEAAQRLAEEATRTKPPPNGWDVPRRASDAGDELDAVVRMLTTLRDVLPDELRAQLAELVRQLLVFVRAVLDWWIERIEPGPRGDEPRVEDIPIR